MTDPALTIRKAALRSAALDRRDALGADVRAALSERIVAAIAKLAASRAPKYVAAYAPMRSEVEVLPLLDLMIAEGAAACLPAVDGDGLVFRIWTPGTDLVPGPFSTAEPPSDATPVNPDLIVLPLAAFDRAGHRLGYGRGFYDRALARLHAEGRRPWLVGAAFAVQEVDDIPAEPHDVPLDAVVTETEAILVRTA